MSETAAAVTVRAPRLAWWGLALVLDATVLVLFPHVGWLALLFGGTLATAWLVREPHRALAFAVLGQPFVGSVAYALRLDLPVALSEQFLVLVPLGIRFWHQVWVWPQPQDRVQRTRDVGPLHVVSWTILLGIALGIGLLWTPSPSYGRSKFILYAIRNGIFLVGAWKLLQTDFRGKSGEQTGVAFLRGLVLLALAIAVVSFWNLSSGYWPFESRLSVLDLNPIWFARYLGLGILALLSLVVMRRVGAMAAAASLSLLIPPFYLAGSRGPLLALLVAVCFFLLIGRSWNTPFRRFILVAVPALSVTVAVISLAQGALEQWSPFGSHAASNVAREMMLRVAWEWASQPGWFGFGAGAYSSLIGVGDIRFYPHNIFVEVWLENGVLGTVALLGFFLATLQVWRRSRRERAGLRSGERELVRFAATWFVFSFINAQFSGDLPGNEHLFLAAGALLAWTTDSGRSEDRSASAVGPHEETRLEFGGA